MRKLLYSVLCLALLASLGCAITNYGVITDDRADFSGVIRTGHKAYVTPTSQIATIWSDGSDELFTMVYQNQYADRKLYTFNNFDPTASVLFLDQTYCDWRYEGCEITRAWDPHQDALDDPFDFEFFEDCSGARSLSLLVSQESRLGECGDRVFADLQNLAGEFADLPVTQFRGEAAYVIPVNAGNTNVSVTTPEGVTASVPLYGQFTGFVTEKLQVVIPMTPNMKSQLNWARNFVDQNGNLGTVEIQYGSLNGTVSLAVARDGLIHNANRF
ncbi:MAG: hypothetical protein Q9Q40_01760 [Acidobacteriota bacterium]|nr:hypothetical protein [Acidobacteriota bacterium]MDQ7087120.1 hypothetical protein [Acidobacteriota bacterium]